jgi:hypothetical protein
VAQYFPWYDELTGSHMSPLGLHPPEGEPFSWRDVRWHQREFGDMLTAGIDIAICEFWPGEGWSLQAVPVMVEALDALAAQGQTGLHLGLFYDNTPWYDRDLTADWAKRAIYKDIHDFYTAVPPQYWGRIDERPVVWFYDIGGGGMVYDQSVFDDLYAWFEADFGVRPYIVLDRTWLVEHDLHVDGTYTWGVAFLGYQPRDTIAEAGAGYDDSGVPGRQAIIIPRANGAWYARNMYYALSSGKDVLYLETWNEHHESTNLNQTVEFGRTYIDLTRQYVDMFRRGEAPPKPAGGPYAQASSVSAELNGEEGVWDGLQMLDVPGDGLWRAVEAGGKPARQTTGSALGRYLYFALDDDFASFDEAVSVSVSVTYLDQGTGTLIIEYDSYEPGQPDWLGDHYRPVEIVPLRNSGEWRTAKVVLKKVRFANGQNGGADFRLWAGEDKDITVRRVTLSRQ